MKAAVLVLLVLVAAAVAAQPQPVPIVPVPATNLRAASSPSPAQRSPASRIHRAALWHPLVRMSPQERANGEMVITANAAEAREVEALWNSGEYDAAIAALQRWSETADLRHVSVGFNWRVPIQSSQTDWGPNVRIGTRDSAYRVAFDRENSTGNLLVSSACRAGANTNWVVDLSTNGGSTWTETYFAYWGTASIVTDMEMTGSAGFEYVVFLLGTALDSAYCYRINATTGLFAKMPDSTTYKTVLGTSVYGDTLDQVAITSSDDQFPGWEIEVVGGTRGHMVEAGYTQDQGATWGHYLAWNGLYWGGLDYCYNHYDTTGPRSRYVIFSCLHNDSDTLYPAYAYYDTTWHAFFIPTATRWLGSSQTTGIAAWKDTVVLALPHYTASGVAVRCYVSYDAFNTIGRTVDLTNTFQTRENVAICGRLGDGFAVTWRDYDSNEGRWAVYRHSDYACTTWTGPDSVSDLQPDWADRPRVQRVAPGVHAVCYITWDTSAYGSLWFTREDWTGITSPAPERIVPTGLTATPLRGGARLSFTNPVAGLVQLAVYDAAGRRVLANTSRLKAGAQTLDCAVPASGTYIAVLKTPAVTATAKFSTLK